MRIYRVVSAKNTVTCLKKQHSSSGAKPEAQAFTIQMVQVQTQLSSIIEKNITLFFQKSIFIPKRFLFFGNKHSLLSMVIGTTSRCQP